MSIKTRYSLVPKRRGSPPERRKPKPKVSFCSTHDVFEVSRRYMIVGISKQEYEAGFQSRNTTDENKRNRSGEPAPKRDKFAGLSRKAKRRKLAAEADKEFNDQGAMASAIRAAKRAERPPKIGEYVPPKSKSESKGRDGRKKSAKPSVKERILGRGPRFARDMSERNTSGGNITREGIRAKKGDGGILGGKKIGKGSVVRGKGKRHR